MSYTRKHLLMNESILKEGKVTLLTVLPGIIGPLVFYVIIYLVIRAAGGSLPGIGGYVSLITSLMPLVLARHVIEGIAFVINTELTLTNKRLVFKQGIFSRNTTDVPLANVNTITVKTPFAGRIIGYGEIHITTSSDNAVKKIKCIKQPDVFKQAVIERISDIEEEKNNLMRGMAGSYQQQNQINTNDNSGHQ